MGLPQKLYVPQIEVIDPLEMASGHRRSQNFSARRMTFHKSGSVVPPAPWTPTTETGLKIWYDSALQTVVPDGTAMSTLIESSTAYVNGVATLTTRPLYKTGIDPLGGPAILFDGVDDFFDMSSTAPTGLAEASPWTWVIIAKPLTKGAGNQFGVILSIRSNTNSAVAGKKANFAISYCENQVATYGNNWSVWADPATSTGIGDNGTYVGANHINIITWDGSGNANIANTSAHQHLLNGSAQALTAHGTGGHAVDPSYIGRWEGGTLPYKGYLYELLAYDHVLSSTVISNIATYNLTKRGF